MKPLMLSIALVVLGAMLYLAWVDQYVVDAPQKVATCAVVIIAGILLIVPRVPILNLLGGALVVAGLLLAWTFHPPFGIIWVSV